MAIQLDSGVREVVSLSHPAPETTATPSPDSRIFAPISRRELGLAVLFCALAVTLFLGPALFTGRVLSPADLLFGYYPWRTQAPAGWTVPANGLLSDSVFQFEPWLIYSAQRLHAGALPLWNPESMLGAPFFGNMQSAIFYPANWPYFIWPGPEMLVVRAWIKLFMAALGMYLLARQVLRVGPAAASIATVAFTFGAFMTVWLLYSQTSVVGLLPWLWWATARLVARPGARSAALLTGLVALALFAGQPQAVVHVALATGLFALFLFGWVRPFGIGRVLRAGALVFGAWGLGAAVAAVQLLPFLEYTSISWAALLRDAFHIISGTPIPVTYAWTLFSPELYGNPAQHTGWGPINYNESNIYIGLVPLLLAPFAWFARDRLQRHLRWFLPALCVLALGVVYQAPILDSLVNVIPVLDVAQNQRLVLVAQFALALLAGLGYEGLRGQLPAGRGRLALVLGLTLLGLLSVGLVVPWVFAGSVFAVPAGSSEARALWQGSLQRSTLLLLAGGLILIGVVILWRARPRLARGLLLLLPLLAFADLELAHGGYNPTVAPRDYFPATAATTFLQQQAGLFRIVGVGWTLMPDTNMAYGLAGLGGYDSIEPRLYHDLAEQLDPTRVTRIGPDPFHQVQSPILNLLNVRYVLAAPGDDPNYVTDVSPDMKPDQATSEIQRQTTVGQTFVPKQDTLTQIAVNVATAGRQPGGKVVFHLKTSPTAPTDLVTQPLDTSGLADGSSWTITFPPVSHLQGQSLYFYFEPLDVPPDQGVSLRFDSHDAYPEGTRMENGRPAGGDLAFTTTALLDQTNPWFVRVLDGGAAAASVFENRRALPRAWLTHAVEVLDTPKAVRLRLSAADFDAAGTALLSEPLSPTMTLPAQAPLTGADAVTITQYEPESIAITTNSPAAGVLILSDEAFPGWEATLDGRAVPILTVDYGLRGIYLPAGAHQVRFVYAPQSVQVGAEITGGALLGVGLLVVVPAIRGRRGRQRSPTKS